MKPISTRLHGVVDYMTVPVLLGLPRLAGWQGDVRRLLTALGLVTLATSLLTNYELGLFKLIPFKGHLALDVAEGATLLAAPLRMADTNTMTNRVLVGLGIFSWAVVALSRTRRG